MIRLAGINPNDIVDGNDICVSVWLQGCPHRCPQCHNPETWSFSGGKEYNEEEAIEKVISLISKNGIQRNLSLLGGEPLCPQNINFSLQLAKRVKEKYPNIKVFCWTGYLLEELDENKLKDIDILIDGKYDYKKRDITLYLRGSSNQRVLYKKIDFLKK